MLVIMNIFPFTKTICNIATVPTASKQRINTNEVVNTRVYILSRPE